ncbi:MAG: hypothetical protein J6S17_00025 [Aeriscardovia sp.]|nr:hypothetical protein [Aeriscardovia sp.]
MIGTREERTAKKNKSGGKSRWRNFFKNISFAQIAASGLSAITVFFLTAKIGLAGSIIGAALASIISTISSQLYKNVIDESSKRIKGNRDDDQDEDENKGEKEKESRREERRSVSAPIYLEQDELPAQFSPHLPPRLSSARPRHAKPVGRTVSSSSTVVPSAPLAPVKSFRKERKKTKKKVIAVSIISSLLTLVVVCGIILFVTGGKGTDVFLRDAVNKSKSIKEDAQKLTNQAEESSSSSSTSSTSSAPSSGSSAISPASPSAPSTSTSSPAPSTSSETKSPSTSGSDSGSVPAPSQSGEKTEVKQPSTSSAPTNSSPEQSAEGGKEKEKKSPSTLASNPSSSSSNTADQNFKKD